tara:strand:+ start:11859 stop:12281 length:423 start_codon:yes stop_codon:yes gene_type:complete
MKTYKFDQLLGLAEATSSVLPNDLDYMVEKAGEYEQTHQPDRDLLTFIKKRREGAQKIATASDRKSGPARLTAKHFNAKLPVYDRIEKMVNAGKDLKSLKREYNKTLSSLRKNIRQPMKFQELTGKLEVLGEILIESHLM